MRRIARWTWACTAGLILMLFAMAVQPAVAQVPRDALLVFEKNVKWAAVSNDWAGQRDAWIRAVKSAGEPADVVYFTRFSGGAPQRFGGIVTLENIAAGRYAIVLSQEARLTTQEPVRRLAQELERASTGPAEASVLAADIRPPCPTALASRFSGPSASPQFAILG